MAGKTTAARDLAGVLREQEIRPPDALQTLRLDEKIRRWAGLSFAPRTDFAKLAQARREIATEPPSPKRGGTFFYCPWTLRERKAGGVSVSSCGGVQHWGAGTRFRTEAAYRRHWRRAHA